MKRRVEWSTSAIADTRAQVEHIARDNLQAARRVSKAIRAAGNGLTPYATGHPGRVAGTYEKTVSRLPYIIAYALSPDDTKVVILRVIHTSRDWPEEGWPE